MDFMNDYIPIIVGTKLAFSENIFDLIFQFFFRALANKIGILVLKRPCFGDLIPDHTLVLFLPTL